MSSISDIITKQNYLTPSRYISGRIVEYDLRAANISIFRDKDIITEEQYQRLLNLPKINREIEIGLMEKDDPSLYTLLQKGIGEAKDNLAGFNNLNEDQIVRIANDAVYVNADLDLEFTQFGKYVQFKQKSQYDVFCKLLNIIIFCKFLDDGNISVDIKGLDSKGRAMGLHQDYMLNAIISTIALLERSGIEDALDYLSDICEKYVKRELPVGYYRELNTDSLYRLYWTVPDLNDNDAVRTYNYGYSNALADVDKYSLEINYNYAILRELWSILVEIYTIRRR